MIGLDQPIAIQLLDGVEQRLQLGRFVDIGAELFVWSCVISRASAFAKESSPEADHALRLAKFFGAAARERIGELLRAACVGSDGATQEIVASLAGVARK